MNRYSYLTLRFFSNHEDPDSLARVLSVAATKIARRGEPLNANRGKFVHESNLVLLDAPKGELEDQLLWLSSFLDNNASLIATLEGWQIDVLVSIFADGQGHFYVPSVLGRQIGEAGLSITCDFVSTA